MERYTNTYQGSDTDAAEQFRRLSEILSGFRATYLSPTFENGWDNYGVSLYENARFYKDLFDRVYISGTIVPGTTTPGTAIFTLPKGYRPLERNIFPVWAEDNVAADMFCRVDVESNGKVSFVGDAAPDLISLAGISFLAEQ